VPKDLGGQEAPALPPKSQRFKRHRSSPLKTSKDMAKKVNDQRKFHLVKDDAFGWEEEGDDNDLASLMRDRKTRVGQKSSSSLNSKLDSDLPLEIASVSKSDASLKSTRSKSTGIKLISKSKKGKLKAENIKITKIEDNGDGEEDAAGGTPFGDNSRAKNQRALGSTRNKAVALHYKPTDHLATPEISERMKNLSMDDWRTVFTQLSQTMATPEGEGSEQQIQEKNEETELKAFIGRVTNSFDFEIDGQEQEENSEGKIRRTKSTGKKRGRLFKKKKRDNELLVRLDENQLVTVTEQKGDFYHVFVGSQEGWVPLPFVEPLSDEYGNSDDVGDDMNSSRRISITDELKEKELNKNTLYKIVNHAFSGIETNTKFSFKDRKYKRRTYPDAFWGSDFVDWLMEQFELNRERAVEIGNSMEFHGILINPIKDGFKDKKNVYYFNDIDLSEEAIDKIYSLMKSSLEVKTRQKGVRTYRKCFVANQAIDWLVSLNIPELESLEGSREKAVLFYQKLMGMGYIDICEKRRNKFCDGGLLLQFIKKTEEDLEIERQLAERKELLKKMKKKMAGNEFKKIFSEGKANKFFGVPVEFLVPITSEKIKIPPVLETVFTHVEKNVETQGLFRISVCSSDMDEIVSKIDNGEVIHFNSLDPHAAACFIKYFFRELPEPIIPFELWPEFSNWYKENEEMYDVDPEKTLETLKRLKALISKLSELNRLLLERLTRTCSIVAAHSAQNQMDASNISVCIGPNILYSDSDVPQLTDVKISNLVCHVMISHYDFLFCTENTETSK